METVFTGVGLITLLVVLILLAVNIFAFVNSLMFPAPAYEAAGKLTKPAWNLILGLGMVAQVLSFSFLLNLVAIIAALVFLLDVRPALAGLRRR
ncbi:DUF2516 family protein [Nocardioides sp. SYSU D00038]|uniref:DUF2516 family protein n=1 Tax=Nocardioides sp. SYSU D00038 TaxID=2812554 RepID=UPI001966F395|nr:DUF2516 family protein [Nocardioides sp. SYSU D00038]